jgi:hypothetical protein
MCELDFRKFCLYFWGGILFIFDTLSVLFSICVSVVEVSLLFTLDRAIKLIMPNTGNPHSKGFIHFCLLLIEMEFVGALAIINGFPQSVQTKFSSLDSIVS